MTISLIDSASAMARVLDADPDVRADLVREMWAPMAGMYHFIPDGLDLASVHRQNFGFDWENSSDQLREGLKMLVDADGWPRRRPRHEPPGPCAVRERSEEMLNELEGRRGPHRLRKVAASGASTRWISTQSVGPVEPGSIPSINDH